MTIQDKRERSAMEALPIDRKLALTIREGRGIQQHRYQQDRVAAAPARLPLCTLHRDEEADKEAGV